MQEISFLTLGIVSQADSEKIRSPFIVRDDTSAASSPSKGDPKVMGKNLSERKKMDHPYTQTQLPALPMGRGGALCVGASAAVFVILHSEAMLASPRCRGKIIVGRAQSIVLLKIFFFLKAQFDK